MGKVDLEVLNIFLWKLWVLGVIFYHFTVEFSVKPEKGDALLFFSLSVDAKPDESSLHSSCPVIRGEKWSATKWIHVASFDGPGQDPDKCENNDPSCEAWAAAGECTKNPGFMVGTANSLGSCRLACGVCKA